LLGFLFLVNFLSKHQEVEETIVFRLTLFPRVLILEVCINTYAQQKRNYKMKATPSSKMMGQYL
jgi:hypothetical protein